MINVGNYKVLIENENKCENKNEELRDEVTDAMSGLIDPDPIYGMEIFKDYVKEGFYNILDSDIEFNNIMESFMLEKIDAVLNEESTNNNLKDDANKLFNDLSESVESVINNIIDTLKDHLKNIESETVRSKKFVADHKDEITAGFGVAKTKAINMYQYTPEADTFPKDITKIYDAMVAECGLNSDKFEKQLSTKTPDIRSRLMGVVLKSGDVDTDNSKDISYYFFKKKEKSDITAGSIATSADDLMDKFCSQHKDISNIKAAVTDLTNRSKSIKDNIKKSSKNLDPASISTLENYYRNIMQIINQLTHTYISVVMEKHAAYRKFIMMCISEAGGKDRDDNKDNKETSMEESFSYYGKGFLNGII